MIESSEEKKRVFYIIVLALTLIAMIVSTTLAYYSFVKSQKDEETVLYTGTLEVNYIDGVYIKNPELWPKTTVDFNTKKNVYRNTFEVASTGTLDQTISIDLIITRNEFKDKAIKYKLFNSKGLELSTGDAPLDGPINLVNNVYLPHKETATYTLILWLSNTNYDQIEDMGKVVTGKISVYAKQLKY